MMEAESAYKDRLQSLRQAYQDSKYVSRRPKEIPSRRPVSEGKPSYKLVSEEEPSPKPASEGEPSQKLVSEEEPSPKPASEDELSRKPASGGEPSHKPSSTR